MMKKTAALTLAAACSLSLLAGCSSSGSGTETGADAGSAAGQEVSQDTASGDQVEITFTVWDYETTDYWKVLVEAFEKENPDIKVKVTDIGSTDYDT